RLTARFRELEVEAGNRALADGGVPHAADVLRAAGAMAGEPGSKGGRGLRPPLVNAPGIPIAVLCAGAPVGAAGRAPTAGSVTRLLSHDPGVRLGDDPEDVHQARVATRRMRSDLRTLRDFVNPESGAALRAELAWLADVLGAVRDPDVLVDRLRTQI